MFFLYQSKNDINLCARCNNSLDLPKLLPCGNTICINCENDIKSIDHFNCTLCGDTHEKEKKE
jgi:hypothetical protein